MPTINDFYNNVNKLYKRKVEFVGKRDYPNIPSKIKRYINNTNDSKDNNQNIHVSNIETNRTLHAKFTPRRKNNV